MERNDSTIREVELVFEDEPGVAGSSSTSAPSSTFSASTSSSASGAPRFSQTSAPSAGASLDFDEAIRAGRRAFRYRRTVNPADAQMRASFEHDGVDAVRVRSSVIPMGRLSVPVLLGVLGAAAVVGIGAAGAAGAWAVPGVTTPLTGASSRITAVATVTTTVLSSFGALVVTFVVWAAMRARGGRSSAFALVVALWVAWILTGIVSIVAFGEVPYVCVPVAFLAALTAGVSAVVGVRQWIPPLVGAIGVVAVAALLVAAGTATGVGAVGSALVGAAGALLGVKLWNRLLAPIIDAKNRFQERVRSAWNARAA